MEAIEYIIAGPMVYFSVGILIIGTLYKLSLWVKTPASSINLALFPKSGGNTLTDTLFIPEAYKVNKTMWAIAFFLHFAGPLVVLAHLALYFPAVNDNALFGIVQGLLGIGLGAAVLALILTKFNSPYREVCVPEDYILLIFLFLLVFVGNALHFTATIPGNAYQDYISSLLSFKPSLGSALAASPAKNLFVLHLFLVNLFLLYFPFSKLLYWFFGALLTNSIRRG